MIRSNLIVGFLFFLNLLCVFYLSILEENITVFSIWLILFILAFCFSYFLKRLRLFLVTWSIGICFMTFLAIDYSRSYGNFYWGGGSDELNYERDADIYSKKYGLFDYYKIPGGIVKESHNSVGYIYLLGLEIKLSSIFGNYSTFVPRMFNLFFYILVVLIFSLFLERFFHKSKYIFFFNYLFALDMFNIWVSVQVFRDIIQLFFIILGSFFTVKILDSNKFKIREFLFLLIIILLSIIMLGFRESQAFLFLSITILFIFYRFVKKFFFIVFLALLGFVIFEFKNNFLQSALLDLILLTTDNYSLLRASDSGLSNLVFELSIFPYGWIIRILYGLISPLPVVFYPFYMGFLSLSSILHIFLLPFFFIGLTKINNLQLGYLSILYIVFFLSMALITFTFRHIVQFIPFYYIISFLGLINSRFVKRIFFSQIIILTLLLMVYIYLKI